MTIMRSLLLQRTMALVAFWLIAPWAHAASVPVGRDWPPAEDSVQVVLRTWVAKRPDLVGYIPSTGRWYALKPSREHVPDAMADALQDAFFYDVAPICLKYGWRYLADWRVLMAKAARESFWGASYLSNAARNYFGIRHTAKPWACNTFGFCDAIVRDDPDPTSFIVFPDAESSFWLFMHTIYSPHYLERLPDAGARVTAAIAFERTHGVHYWEKNARGRSFAASLLGEAYTSEELIYTWSEHPVNNYCVNCSRQSDMDWVGKVDVVIERVR
jgi:hypothetical protein